MNIENKALYDDIIFRFANSVSDIRLKLTLSTFKFYMLTFKLYSNIRGFQEYKIKCIIIYILF